MIHPPRRTARLRLTALYTGLFLISGVALVASTYVLFEHVTRPSAPHLPTIPRTPRVQPIQHLQPELPRALHLLSTDQKQLSQDQQQLTRLPIATTVSGPGLLAIAPQLIRDEHQLNSDQRRLVAAVHQLSRAEREVAQAGAAQAAQRASDSHELLVDSGIALAVVAVLALLTGWVVAGRMLRPIRTITHRARRISSMNLHERLSLPGPQDELKELGDTLDDLLARLEASFEAQRRFVAHASHELRTPLTRERALVQVALGDPTTSEAWRSAGQELLTSNREQEQLIDALLTLASSESGLDQLAAVDLSTVALTVLHSRTDDDTDGLEIETSLEAARLDGDPRLLERLVANLIDNAIKHNEKGGRVHVSTHGTDDSAVLTVTNSGPIIPTSEIERLFQPFQRLDPRRTNNRNGHGLGLSIVRAVATAHRATLTAQPQPNGGLSISITFPSQPAPASATTIEQHGL